MPKPFDAILKDLGDLDAAALLAWLLGIVSVGIQTVVPELPMDSLQPDRVWKILAALPYLLNIEFQSTYDPGLPKRALVYAARLWEKYDLPVLTVIVLLRPKADGPEMSGVAFFETDGGSVEFRYRVIRLWLLPLSGILSGPASLLPLAPLCAGAPTDPLELVRQVEPRLEQETAPEAEKLSFLMLTLMGLVYSPEQVDSVRNRMKALEDSVTLHMLLDEGRVEGRLEGRVEEARGILLRIGSKRLGPGTRSIASRVNSITNLPYLEALIERTLSVESWTDLFAEG